MADDTKDILTLTTEIVASYAGSAANLRAEDLPGLIRSVRNALSEDSAPPPVEEPTPKATRGQINKSITPGKLISFIDGKGYSTLKRHLTRHGHTVDSYRDAYGLPSDYPLVAADYSAKRSEMARSLGLGAKGRGRAGASKTPTKKPSAKKVARSPE